MFDYEERVYNYGEGSNMKKYGSEKPPLYPLEKVKDLPIVMICGKTDRMC